MAKRSRSTKFHNNDMRGRDVRIIARRSLPRQFNYAWPDSPLLRPTSLSDFDGRRSHLRRPSYLFPPSFTIYGAQAPQTVSFPRRNSLLIQPRYTRPEITNPCIRRKVRREVIFATGRGGRKLNTRRVRRNAASAYSC